MKPIIIVLLSLVSLNALAQVTGLRELSLDDAVKMALEQNYTSRNATFDLDKAQYTKSKASDNLLPSLVGRAGYSYNKGLTSVTTTDFYATPITETSAVPEATHGVNYSLTASFNIFNGFFDAGSIKSADYALDAARYNLKWIRQSVAFTVTSDYVNALRTKELLNSARLTYSQDSAQLVRVQAQYSAGALAVNAVYQQEAVVGQDELLKIQAMNNYENAIVDLLFQLNVPPSRYADFDVSLRGIDTSVTAIKARTNSLHVAPTTISDLLEHREDFASQRATLLSEEEGITVTRAALLPTLNASFGVGGVPSPPSTNISRIPISNSLSGSLTLTVPIFEKFQTGLQIDIERTQLEEGRVLLEQSEQQFRSDISKAENNLQSSEQALDASGRALVSAEESLRSATERLRVGAGIQVDVIVAQAQVQTARTNRVNAVYNYVLAAKQLEYLLGKTNY